MDFAVRKAMAFDRNMRFQNAAEMLDVLAPFAAVQSLVPDLRTGKYDALTPYPGRSASTSAAWIAPKSPSRTSQQTRMAPVLSQPRKRLSIIAGGVAVAAIGVAVIASTQHSSTAHVERAAPITPAMVTIGVDGFPSSGRLIVDGTVARDGSFHAARGSQHRIRVEAPAYQPYETVVTADTDQSLHVALAPVPAVAPSLPQPPPATPAATPVVANGR
jgi:hypothetical protein